MDSPTLKLLHIWNVTVDQMVNETTTETVNGSPATVTREVKRPVTTRMALKQPTRRELKRAELFYGKQFNEFLKMGFLPRSILVNKHLDISGGVLSQTEKGQAEVLIKRHAELEKELKGTSLTPEGRKTSEDEMSKIRIRVTDINNANESIFSQTAEAKARGQLNAWFAYFMILVERGGKWVHYFEGEEFDQKEEFMWKLEENDDAFYAKAATLIATYIGFFNLGASTPEQFAAFESEIAKQEEDRQKAAAAEKAKTDTPPEMPAAPAA